MSAGGSAKGVPTGEVMARAIAHWARRVKDPTLPATTRRATKRCLAMLGGARRLQRKGVW